MARHDQNLVTDLRDLEMLTAGMADEELRALVRRTAATAARHRTQHEASRRRMLAAMLVANRRGYGCVRLAGDLGMQQSRVSQLLRELHATYAEDLRTL